MIFYFTGTGNSYAAALKMQGEGEAIYNITDCVHKKLYTYTLEEEEAVGLVFPVYYGGLPTIISYFLEKLTFKGNAPSYLYAVMTCGGMANGADYMLKQKLEVNGYALDALYTVTMPDNYLLMYNLSSEEENARVLDLADAELMVIHDKVLARVEEYHPSTPAQKTMSAMMYPLYRNGRKTEKFWADDSCVGCGLCAKRCPSKAIRMVDGKPSWVKERCIQCLGCINGCDREAIQYGKKTITRNRYMHPLLTEK